MAGIVMANAPAQIEHLAVQLKDSLQRDSIYQVRYYVNLADYSEFACSNCTDAYLTDTIIDTYPRTPGPGNPPPRRYEGNPQILNPRESILSDTVNWVQICDTYLARGGEKFIIIGAFVDPDSVIFESLNRTEQPIQYQRSYYYIDDVSLYRVPGGPESHTRHHQACGDSLPYTLHARGEYLRYRWSTGDTTRQIEVTAPGTYWVEQSIECASVVDTYHVAVENPAPPPNLGPDRYHCRDDQVQPVLLDAGAQPNYRWSTGDTTRQITVQDSGWYGVAVDYEYCATRQDSVFLRGCPPNYDFRLQMPNVFTPNGDGANDTFGPMEVYNLDYQSLRVYDRWGRLCFEGRAPSDHWDGRYQGQNLPEGTYYYQVRFRRPVTGEPDQQRGVVTLLR